MINLWRHITWLRLWVRAGSCPLLFIQSILICHLVVIQVINQSHIQASFSYSVSTQHVSVPPVLYSLLVPSCNASCSPPLLSRYGTLLELGEKRKDMLEKSCKKFMLFREANELQQWINEKEGALTNEEMGSDLEQVEVLQKKFDDFQKVKSLNLSPPLCRLCGSIWLQYSSYLTLLNSSIQTELNGFVVFSKYTHT